MASEALQKQSAFGELDRVLNKGVAQLAAALPRMGQASAEMHLARAQRAIRCALTLTKATPKLLECSQASIVGSLLQACQLGLELDTVLGQAYLIPRKIKGVPTCQMQVGYKGFIELAYRSGLVRYISAAVVYKCDAFEYRLGSSPMLNHTPALEVLEPGPEVCAWACAYYRDGSTQWEIAGARRIATAEKASRAGDTSPWRTDREAMVRKTAIRELAKLMPQCPDLVRAAGYDEQVESGHAPPQPKLEDFGETIEAESEAVPS